ncbi:NtaA/DmoA family FMN-dependent monooxygenase [Rhodococcus sp. USK13]|uniref:NtaA/DmoA family FMN-dependent monooxygenase n=1 Tax=Rhodococcus sp. USK13 TaxID=2806442 RepID=UPI001BCD4EAB|nr:NtaA/DmoA family FMN-dependent monooxygenase [Rhodococcus sp. USK13]
MPANRPLIWNYFAHFTPFHEGWGTWSSPQGSHMVDGWSDVNRWIDLARVCEEGRFDAIFFGDTIGIYDAYQGSPDAAIRAGLQFPDADPSVLIGALGAATEHLGFAMTSSIIQAHPFEFARRMSTLDMMTNGRVGWNIVTSYLESAARNMGFDGLAEHDERYEMADDYLAATYGLWEHSWEDGATVRNATTGTLYDPKRIHRVDHVGKYFRTAGPSMMQPTAQRTPLLYQAGSSSRGTVFAATHAEVTFLGTQAVNGVARDVQRVREAAVAAGRPEDAVACIAMFAPVIGSTEAEARAKQKAYREALNPQALLAFFSTSGVDMSEIDLNRTISSLLAEDGSLSTTGRYWLEMIVAAFGDPDVSVADAVPSVAPAARFAGTPEQIADEVQRWADAGIDGFNLVPPETLGWADEWVTHVVPVLQRRGLMQQDYAPGTLREKLFRASPRLPESHPARCSVPARA